MFRAMLILGGFVIAFAFVSAPSFAQDWSADPAYGQDYRNAPFSRDPAEVQIMAGGTIAAESSLGQQCSGFIANAPDFNFVLATDDVATLAITAVSASDVSLVVNAPDGHWYCDNNSGGGTNAALVFGDAADGAYNIWVGTAVRELAPTRLTISDLGAN